MFADCFRRGSPFALLLVSIGMSLPGLGCSSLNSCDTSDESNPPDPFYDGTTVDGFYMSSDWTGPLLPFPGGKRYDFHHGLESTPRSVECFVSFGSQGVENGSIAQSSGNLCVIQDVNDEYIRVKNDTCSEMFVMVTAATPEGGWDGGA